AGRATYDSGEYGKALDSLLEISGYQELRAEQSRRRERGDRVQLGIGLSVYVEVTAAGIGPEWGGVGIEPDGTVLVRCGTTSFGQGHETTLAQIAAEELGVPMEQVRVVHSDTDLVERGLAEEVDFDGEGSYPFGAHLAVAEVDVETGDARLLKFFAVDDCGRIINPLLAEGQIHGGIAQGVGQALLEEMLFDANGNPL